MLLESGEYFGGGEDKYGDIIITTYAVEENAWSLVDGGILFDNVYVFQTDGKNITGGCYFRVTDGEFSDCYPLFGRKSSAGKRSSEYDSFLETAKEAYSKCP
ncbi:hypothetical protein QUF80_15105 [Desulfococcaceae bacterium HSG8]|nr:hypothetical protein [Desulfococcaceae bacterium HSG8]